MPETNPEYKETALWRPSERTHRWLLFGIVAALAECAVQLAGTALEVHFWDQDGTTPATALGFVAVLPQGVLLASWLTLARDVDGRSLWKSAAGFFACGWLALVIDLATYQTLPTWVAVALSVLGGLGILALVIFLFGDWPRFSPEDTESSTGDSSGPAASDSSGCVGSLMIVAFLIGLKYLLKFVLRNRQEWFPWFPADVESWAFFELVALGIVGLVFSIWFAVAKIRLRHKLGRLSAALGATELVVGVLHLLMLAAGVVAVIVMVVNDPDIDKATMDEQFDVWGQRAVIVSGALHCLWSAITILFLASLRGRSEGVYDTAQGSEAT